MGRSRSYQRYPADFKRMALMKTAEDGITDAKICEELGISDRQLRRWRDEFRLLADDAYLGQVKFHFLTVIGMKMREKIIHINEVYQEDIS